MSNCAPGVEHIASVRDQLLASITSMEGKQLELRKRLEANRFYLQHPHTNTYEPEALRREIPQIEAQVEVVETALTSERARLSETAAALSGAEKILQMHSPFLVCQARGNNHAWKVTSVFESGRHRGKWRKRECTVCPTTEKQGR